MEKGNTVNQQQLSVKQRVMRLQARQNRIHHQILNLDIRDGEVQATQIANPQLLPKAHQPKKVQRGCLRRSNQDPTKPRSNEVSTRDDKVEIGIGTGSSLAGSALFRRQSMSKPPKDRTGLDTANLSAKSSPAREEQHSYEQEI